MEEKVFFPNNKLFRHRIFYYDKEFKIIKISILRINDDE